MTTTTKRSLPLSHIAVVAAAGLAAASSVAYVATHGLPGSQTGADGRRYRRRGAKKAKALFSSSTSLSDDAVALEHLLAAFGPDGRNAQGTVPGCMVASPSKEGDGDSNNYWFCWPRDHGICVRSLVEAFKQAEEGRQLGYTAEEIERRIHEFIDLSLKLQRVANPSGTFETGGLGEPKFNVDGSAFEGSWGRPQNDGPALRTISVARYMRHILDTRPNLAGANMDASRKFLLEKVWSSKETQGEECLIRDDLNYICREWKGKTFELWEEVCADAGAGGGHFHVLMTQRRALLEGIALARRSETQDEEAAAKWEQAAHEITKRLEKFWNPRGLLELEGGTKDGDNINWNDERHLDAIPKSVLNAPHVVPTLSRVSGQRKPTQADCAVLLGFTHGFDGDLGVKADDTWEPWSDRSLASLDRILDVFGAVYPVNQGLDASQAEIVVGRYPEDVYDGVGQSIGNPWFLCTFAVSTVLSLTAAHYAQTSAPIQVTPFNLGLLQKAFPGNVPQSAATTTTSYPRGSKQWEGILAGLRRMAEQSLLSAARFADQKEGKMSEQIDRYTGKMRGARELSWSYAALLSAHQARSELIS
ncbi:unnamed protein product [Parajaminaea phylloscopi]